jgi:hypothetical protein
VQLELILSRIVLEEPIEITLPAREIAALILTS